MTKIESHPDENDPESLGDREARLRAILETSVEGIITIDERGNIESMNPSAERLFGYSEAEAVGHNVTLLMPAPYREEHDGYLEKYRDTGSKKIIGIGRDVIGKRKDGTTFPMHLSVSEVPLSTGRIFTGFVHDLSERVTAEQDLRRLATIVRDSNDAITLQQFDGTILEWNHAAERMYGYTADEAVGMNILSIVPEACQHQSMEFREKLAHDQRIVSLDTQKVAKDGRVIDVWLTATVLHDPEGRPIAIATTERDVTEKKRIHDELEKRVEERTQELREAHDELIRKERLATLGKLAGGVAHEIRNPLGVIRNATYFLKQSSDKHDPDVLESFEEIQRALATSSHIVGELLDYARDPQPNHTPFSADDAVDNALRTLNIDPKVSVERAAPSNLHCMGDQGQIERILINLINNAVQAMPSGGTLSLGCHGDQDTVSFEVSDTGVGISAEYLGKVFDPLFTQKAKGIGLGLAISRRYAELNQGEIDVESEPDNGSTFRLTLPRSISSSAGEVRGAGANKDESA